MLDESFARTALMGAPIAIRVLNSTDVDLENNTLVGPGLSLENGIKLTDSGAVVLKDNHEE